MVIHQSPSSTRSILYSFPEFDFNVHNKCALRNHRSDLNIISKVDFHNTRIMSHIPNLDNTPALMPPPGVVPNFVNPESRAIHWRIVLCATLALTLAFVAFRLYVRLRVPSKFGADDREPYATHIDHSYQ